jgi:hypothetical protein
MIDDHGKSQQKTRKREGARKEKGGEVESLNHVGEILRGGSALCGGRVHARFPRNVVRELLIRNS